MATLTINRDLLQPGKDFTTYHSCSCGAIHSPNTYRFVRWEQQDQIAIVTEDDSEEFTLGFSIRDSGCDEYLDLLDVNMCVPEEYTAWLDGSPTCRCP